MNIIEKWNQSRDIPFAQQKTEVFLKRNRHRIATLIRYSLPILTLFTIFSSINYISRSFLQNSSINNIEVLMYWFTISTAAFFISKYLGFRLAKTTFNSIQGYGEFTTFRMTNGDEQLQKKLDSDNRRYERNIMGGFVLSFLLNVLCSVISARLYDLF